MDQTVAPEVRDSVLSFMKHLRSVASDCEYMRCLIAYHAAPTLLGIKPATLFCPHAGRRDLDKALGECAPCLAHELGVEVAGFRNRAGALLLLVYRPELLASTLAASEVTELLAETGYEVEGADWRVLLDTLGRKCSGAAFPHEIGVFLGYPASDVRMFMRNGGDAKAAATAWRAYGDVDMAVERSEWYRAAKVRAAKMIVAGESLQGFVSGLALKNSENQTF